MPETHGWTLHRLFFGRFARDTSGRRKLERNPAMDELKERMAEQVGGLKWKLISKEIAKQIATVLDIPIADRILAPVWSKMEGLQEYRDPALHPAGESSIVPLVSHSVTSEHAPHVDLLAKGIEIGRLEIKVDAGLGLEGVALRIQDGKIWQVQSGSCSGSGKLECAFRGQSIYQIERSSRKFDFKNGVSFDKGIPIPPLPRDDQRAELGAASG